MENKNVLNDKDLKQVKGGNISKPDTVATVKEEDILKEMKLPDFNLNTLPEIVTGLASAE